MTAPRWAERYALCRFKDGGREHPNVDCWGAIRLVLKERTGGRVIVDTYGATSAAELLAVSKAMQADAALPPWIKVDRPKELDVVTMTGRENVEGRRVNIVCHVGIMVSETMLLHVEKASDAAIVPLDHFSVRDRIVGFYRHEALA